MCRRRPDRAPELRDVARRQARAPVTVALFEGRRQLEFDERLAPEPLHGRRPEAVVRKDTHSLVLELGERAQPVRVKSCSSPAKQSMHSSGSMIRIRSNSWMQSTGQTSTQDRSLMSMHGSAMMYVTAGQSTDAISPWTSSFNRSSSADLATT